MNVTGLSVALMQPREPIVSREPIPLDADALRAVWLAANPVMPPAEALKSNAELGPPTGGPRADNHVSKIHSEIKVNGKVVARVYNSGGIEIANEYRFLSQEIDFSADTMVGPDLAESRAERVKAVLERYGAAMKDEMTLPQLMSATLAKTPMLEILRARTAQTQAEWMADKAKEGPLDPGTFFSRVA